MDKNGNIIIGASDFLQGIGDSPYTGLGAMNNLDIYSKKGVLRIAYALEKESSTTIVENVKYLKINPNSGIVYGLDADEQVYQRTVGGVWSTIAGNSSNADNGLEIWNDYLFTVDSGTDQSLSVYGPLSGSPSWDTNWEDIKTGETANHSPSIVSQSGDMWFGTERWLAQITEVSGQTFDPGNGSTYTVSEDVFIGVDGYNIRAIEDDGYSLILGTTFGDDKTRADILTWNPEKSGTTAAFADQRIPTGGDGVQQLTLLGSTVIATTGENGDVVATNLSQVEGLKEINSLTTSPDIKLNIQPDAISNHNNGVMMGLGKRLNGMTDQPVVWYYRGGVWTSFDVSIGQNDTGTVIGSILSISDSQYLVSWEDVAGATFGVDVLSEDTRYQNYTAYFESKFYPVGRHLREETFQHLGFKLAKPLQADQGVRIKYRKSIDAAWTTIGTWDFDTYGAIEAYEDKAGMITNLTNVQLRVELTTGTSDTTPELMEVYLM